MASSEPSTSRLLEEDSSDMDSDSDMRFHKLTLTVKSLHLSGLLSLQKSDRVSIVESMQRISHGPQLRERDLLLPSV